MCPFRKFDELYPREFREWISNITRLYTWRKAGYEIRDELSFEDWQALAFIARWYEVKDLEATAAARIAGLP